MSEYHQSYAYTGETEGNNRKKWNRNTNITIIPNKDDQSSKARPNGPVNTHYNEYLAQLHERNKQRKELEKMDTAKKELKEREQGFNLCFSGANKLRTNSEFLIQTNISKSSSRRQLQNRSDNTFNEQRYSSNVSNLRGHYEKSSNFTLVKGGSRSPKLFEEDNTYENNADGNSVIEENNQFSKQQQPESNYLIEKLNERIRKMDIKQQENLLKVLGNLDQKEENLEHNIKMLQKRDSSTIEKKQLIFRIISAWGNDRIVGLTEIELYAADDKKYFPLQSQVTVNNGFGGNGTIMRLFNGQAKTTSSKDMWQATLSTFNDLEIVVNVPEDIQLSKIVIWNFNKNINESVKGVKELEILENGNMLWKGIIQKGCGNNVFDYSTTIRLGISKSRPNSQNISRRKSSLISPEIIEQCSKSSSGSESEEFSKPESAIRSTASKQDSYQITNIEQRISRKSSRETQRVVQPLIDNASTIANSTGVKCLETSVAADQEDEESKATTIFDEVNNMPISSRRRTSTLEQSMDSLMHFAFAHSGRLRPRDVIESDSSSDDDVVLDEAKSFSSSSRPTSQLKETRVKVQEKEGGHRSKWDQNARNISIIPTKEEIQESGVLHSKESFQKPVKPSGRNLTINCKESWGDPHYIGLSGIEIFDHKGKLITFSNIYKQVTANPSDINSLPEYTDDPRTINKLFDGVNNTSDDMHVWLAPYTPGNDHFIYVTFDKVVTLSMIRFWNYNKSRIHSYRGVKLVDISLDGILIFSGQIRRAPGAIDGAVNFAEHILFTNEAFVLNSIKKYDAIKYPDPEDLSVLIRKSFTGDRPKTTSEEQLSLPSTELESDAFNPDLHFKNMDPLERPTTGTLAHKSFTQTESIQKTQNHENIAPNESLTANNIGRLKASIFNEEIQQTIQRAKACKAEIPHQDYECILQPIGHTFKFSLISTHGDPHYIGLNAIEMYDANCEKIQLTSSNISAEPRDITELPECKNDVRTIDKLIDGVNDTWNGGHMWLSPFFTGKISYVYIIFDEPVAVSMIKFWNYSKTPERGVEEIEIYADDILIYKGQLRKAPSFSERNQKNSFAQSILFTNDQALCALEKGNIYRTTTSEQVVMFINDNRKYLASQEQRNLYQQERKKINSRNSSSRRPMTSVQSIK